MQTRITDNTAVQLKEENELLKRRVSELDAFARTVAHDLKNPLATITGFASLIKDYPQRLSPDDVHETVGFVLAECKRLEEMIDSILLFSQVNNSDEFTIERLDMHQIVENVYLRLFSMVGQYNARINMPMSWPVSRGYAPWVESIWANFISNAIKYGGEPPVIELGAEDSRDGQIVYWVHDNGKGLSPSEQEAVFQPYKRLGQTNVDGQGLGLAIVTRIVDKLKGHVWVESSPEQGTTFYFSLPRA